MRKLSFLFFASGFAGLIYESIWTHYLKLFLGHAAYAQTLVLGIFMGGMAIGAGLAARHSTRLKRPLLAYAVLEATIGLLAFAFHPLFVTSTGGFYDYAYTSELHGASYATAKWTLAALLILPQSILLGATFPVFAAATTRGGAATGSTVATLYFTNSLGGALGVLASGFVLIPALALPGTLLAAGIINLAIALIIARLARNVAPPTNATIPVPNSAAAAPLGRLPRLLVATAFLTGATSFIYEVGWIRMLSLVLGSATHAFELMLCAFIVGLALGGLWVRRRIDRQPHPGRFLGYVQIVMGAAAIATIPLYNATFDLTAWVLSVVPRSDGGYALFNLVRYGIASLVMFPAAFCAGMTLPLATRLLHAEAGQGERAIGMIYSANTLGAIVGLVFAVHVGFPVLGLHYLVSAGALVDVLLGIGLLLVFGGRERLRLGVAALAALATCLAGSALAALSFNPEKLVSGVFRSGQATLPGHVLQIAHGRTASISVDRNGSEFFIRTNGKADASAIVGGKNGEYKMDEVTMALLAAVPLMLHESPQRVANIGFGAGITSATLLQDPRIRQLDTIEIEPAMVALARHFDEHNHAVYTDPRSAIHIDDAKAFFAASGHRYDIIISEPSNPWVSGVAGLFSVEFYRHAARHLARDGLFVQWLQMYETHPDRVAAIIQALDPVFEDYLIVALNHGDLLLVARPQGRIALPADGFARLSAPLAQHLRRLEIAHQGDIAQRVIGNRQLFAPWIAARHVPANSDFAPYLDNHADRDRFIGHGWSDAPQLALSPFPLAEMLGARPPLPAGELPSVNGHFGDDPVALAAHTVLERLVGASPRSLPIPANLPASAWRRAEQVLIDCRNPPRGDKPYALVTLALKVLPFLPPQEARAVLAAAAELPCFRELPPAQALWPELLRQVAARHPAGMADAAERLLDQGQGATEVRAQYLLGMALLGRLGAGDAAAAHAIWSRHQAKLKQRPLNLGVDILAAHALAAAPRKDIPADSNKKLGER